MYGTIQNGSIESIICYLPFIVAPCKNNPLIIYSPSFLSILYVISKLSDNLSIGSFAFLAKFYKQPVRNAYG
jgi:hypothetical protein